MPNARKNQRHRREQRAESAAERRERYNVLTMDERIARAIQRGGPESREVKRLVTEAKAMEGE
jgi:hypothetical protein